MAAIISQMAANKRARQKNAHHYIVGSDKCVYTLPPFDPCFDPLVHNKGRRESERERKKSSEFFYIFLTAHDFPQKCKNLKNNWNCLKNKSRALVKKITNALLTSSFVSGYHTPFLAQILWLEDLNLPKLKQKGVILALVDKAWTARIWQHFFPGGVPFSFFSLWNPDQFAHFVTL